MTRRTAIIIRIVTCGRAPLAFGGEAPLVARAKARERVKLREVNGCDKPRAAVSKQRAELVARALALKHLLAEHALGELIDALDEAAVVVPVVDLDAGRSAPVRVVGDDRRQYNRDREMHPNVPYEEMRERDAM